jgi:L-rhamnose isomerase
MKTITREYSEARRRYAELGVDTDKALAAMGQTSLSIHCWQADDVGGFERPSAILEGGGILATGSYPGKARSIAELKQDMTQVFSLLPGNHRLSLHASYGDFGGRFVDRDSIGPEHFKGWIDWAKESGSGLDFNSTFFSHPKAADGFTLSHTNKGIREFWIEHGKRCREISAAIGRSLKSRCIHNIWIPDGSKDITVNRYRHRELLRDSLDALLAPRLDARIMRDAVESKLFGIGSESYVVGSHEFYLGYAAAKKIILTIDIGHYHPTESCADKVSALLLFVDNLLFHVTRSVRWDSDHIVIMNDPVMELMQEIVWSGRMNSVFLGLDFFDASVNRIGAYVVGARSTLKALLAALLQPIAALRAHEERGENFERLALMEEMKTMPLGAVWDYYCESKGVPAADAYIPVIRAYERQVLSRRK